ncbi:hypothetical protein SKM57_08725 [Acinetobacter faecalis]|uniref:hypothetical protein n=1 Tax=Acinetobacter faecalis TaxID=2665161 RepID=UPI002A9198B4|nr:hypothetical protein [Acinetobacter faecalis]MDY6457131.1 hypothetical protein [Acinetobacter faecalis]MDY6468658.1 hypothetical protein [Acinetobacter faecalis]
MKIKVQRLELFKLALTQCLELLDMYLDLTVAISIKNQLQFLIESEINQFYDSQKLKSIIIGVQTAREIEVLDLDLAEILYQVSFEVNKIIAETNKSKF